MDPRRTVVRARKTTSEKAHRVPTLVPSSKVSDTGIKTRDVVIDPRTPASKKVKALLDTISAARETASKHRAIRMNDGTIDEGISRLTRCKISRYRDEINPHRSRARTLAERALRKCARTRLGAAINHRNFVFYDEAFSPAATLRRVNRKTLRCQL